MPKILNETTEMVPINRLIPHARNINQGDYGAIEESMKAHGFFGSLVVQKSSRQILAGNHRFHVAKNLGYSELPVVWVDCSDEDALRIMLSDNRTSRLGLDDPAKLAALLTELAGTDDGLFGTSYDGDFLDDLLSDLTGPKPKSDKRKPGIPAEGSVSDRDTSETHEGEGDDLVGRQEGQGRLGVIVLCDGADEQDHVLQRIIDFGWSAQKTTFSEQAFTRLKTER